MLSWYTRGIRYPVVNSQKIIFVYVCLFVFVPVYFINVQPRVERAVPSTLLVLRLALTR